MRVLHKLRYLAFSKVYKLQFLVKMARKGFLSLKKGLENFYKNIKAFNYKYL
jgi:hypothetical protein